LIGSTIGHGATRYTYTAARQLIRVEKHDGIVYQPRAEMQYNGLGERMRMTGWDSGLSVTTTYVLDLTSRNGVLAATSGAQTTYYLYSGSGPIAERTNTWTYYLRDGAYTPRQMTDASGLVTLTRSYTPWGEVLTQSGNGNFTWGYFGGLMDVATGLIYVGGGQYYDPATGRFLTPANTNGPNPYVPWRGDFSSAMFGPVLLGIVLLRRRKGKYGKFDQFLLMTLLLVGLSTGLVACAQSPNPNGTGTPIAQPSSPPLTDTATPTAPLQQPTSMETATPAPTQTHTATPCPPTVMPTPTVDPTLLVTFSTAGTANWTEAEKNTIRGAAIDVALALSREINRDPTNETWVRAVGDDWPISPTQAFLRVYGGAVDFQRHSDDCTTALRNSTPPMLSKDGECGGWAFTWSTRLIWVFSNAEPSDVTGHPRWIVHEMGHAFENGTTQTRENGSTYKPGRDSLPADLLTRKDDYGFYGGFSDWQYSKDDADDVTGPGEIFADMFIGWVYDKWQVNAAGEIMPGGVERSNHMNSNMRTWIKLAMENHR